MKVATTTPFTGLHFVTFDGAPSASWASGDAVVAIVFLGTCIVLIGVSFCCHGACGSLSRPSLRDVDAGQIGKSQSQHIKALGVAFTASLPCLLDGVSFVLASGVLDKIDQDHRLHVALRACVVGAFQVGQILSALVFSQVMDRIGRKYALQIVALGQALAFSVLIMWPRSMACLIACRLVLGVFFGQTVAPVYIAEAMLPEMRGAGVSAAELFTNLGGLLAIVLLVVSVEWPLRSIWIVLAALAWLSAATVSLLPADVRRDATDDLGTGCRDIPLAMWPRAARKGLFIACTLGFLQQSAGEEAVYGFCVQIARDAHLSRPFLFGLCLATTTVICNLISGGIVDRAGRRIMLVVGMSCMSVAWAAAGIALWQGTGPLAVLGSILAYEVFFSLSLGPGFFVVASELLPDVHRAQGLAMALLISRLTACVMVLTFEFNATLLTLQGTFFAYALFMLSGAVFIYCLLPETVGRRFSEIQRELDRD